MRSNTKLFLFAKLDYFFYDVINKKNFDPNNIKIDEKSSKLFLFTTLDYFSDDIINIKNFDPNNIKIDEKSYKIILIYYIGRWIIYYIYYM